MSSDTGSSTSSVIDLARVGAAARWAHVRNEQGHAELARLAAKPFPFSPPSASQPRIRHDDALPINDFLVHLHREKRRSERSNAPLSLVLYSVEVDGRFSARHADALLEVLHRAKRETDILGHVGEDMIAVLCPDTDNAGAQGFMRKIEDCAAELPCQAVAATYPDQLFDNLANGARERAVFQPFLVPDTTHRRRVYPLKRVMDIVGAVVAFIVFGPFMLAAALAVKLSSRGPVIFKQTRLGQDGVPFTFYKFRSMAVNTDDSIHRQYVAQLIQGEPPPPASGGMQSPGYKMKSDPRITRIGRILRKTSLDELPQFFNVLKGDMSLVGPRPPIPYEAENYQSWHLRRLLTLKPGITGLWQVEGRSTVTFNEMVRMDLRYIRDCSLMVDLRILLKTVLVVIRCEGAA
jgi:lipopolysaccharide/colanic/teichoic acid biosynthesis glycosyltransferase